MKTTDNNTQPKWVVGQKTRSDGKYYYATIQEATQENCQWGYIYSTTIEDAEFTAQHIVKCVNMHDKLVSQLSTAYAMLQVLSNKDVNIAVATDATRASLRNLLAEATNQDAETIQNQIEELARNK